MWLLLILEIDPFDRGTLYPLIGNITSQLGYQSQFRAHLLQRSEPVGRNTLHESEHGSDKPTQTLHFWLNQFYIHFFFQHNAHYRTSFNIKTVQIFCCFISRLVLCLQNLIQRNEKIKNPGLSLRTCNGNTLSWSKIMNNLA